jgi:hypothetical protein
VTTLTFKDAELVNIEYFEPAASLYKESTGGVGA